MFSHFVNGDLLAKATKNVMTAAVFRRKCTRVQETDNAAAEGGKRPMLFLALTCEIVEAVFNVTSLQRRH